MNLLGFLYSYFAYVRAADGYTDVHNINPKVIDVNIDVYISDNGRRLFSNKMGDVEASIDEVRQKLTNAFGARANNDQTDKYAHFRFNIVIQPEMPEGIDLDECGLSPIDIINRINLVHMNNVNRHILIFYNCPAEKYRDVFINANLDYPLISVTDNITCTNRSATFVSPEISEFEITLANYLTKAAGCPFDNAITITSEDGGDLGVIRNFFIAKKSYDAMFYNRCGVYN